MGTLTPGSRVRVAAPPPAGHVRTPGYLQGRVGIVDANLGAYRRPEDLAYGRLDGPVASLYRVRFRAADVFERAHRSDTITADIYAGWLEMEQ